MSNKAHIGAGERGSRYLTDLIRYKAQADILDVERAANGRYVAQTPDGSRASFGYGDSDATIIEECEALIEDPALLNFVSANREVIDRDGTGMNYRRGMEYVETNEQLREFLLELLTTGDTSQGGFTRVYAHLFGGQGSGVALWIADQIREQNILSPNSPERGRVEVDVGLPFFKRGDQSINTRDGHVMRYEDFLDKLASVEADSEQGVWTTAVGKGNAMGAWGEFVHRNTLTLDQIKSVTGPLREDNDWTALYDHVRRTPELKSNSGVGLLNTNHIRTEVSDLLREYAPGNVRFIEEGGGTHDRTDLLAALRKNTVTVPSYVALSRMEAVEDASHFSANYEDAVAAAARRSLYTAIAGFSRSDVDSAVIHVATDDGTPQPYLSTARNALAAELGGGTRVSPIGISNMEPQWFVDGVQPDVACWVQFGVSSLLPAYEALDEQL